VNNQQPAAIGLRYRGPLKASTLSADPDTVSRSRPAAGCSPGWCLAPWQMVCLPITFPCG